MSKPNNLAGQLRNAANRNRSAGGSVWPLLMSAASELDARDAEREALRLYDEHARTLEQLLWLILRDLPADFAVSDGELMNMPPDARVEVSWDPGTFRTTVRATRAHAATEAGEGA